MVAQGVNFPHGGGDPPRLGRGWGAKSPRGVGGAGKDACGAEQGSFLPRGDPRGPVYLQNV